jgi:hypothetical protein
MLRLPLCEAPTVKDIIWLFVSAEIRLHELKGERLVEVFDLDKGNEIAHNLTMKALQVEKDKFWWCLWEMKSELNLMRKKVF